MNINIILGRDWLTQLGVHMHYDLVYLKFGNSHIRMEEDIEISTLVRLSKEILISQVSCVCIK